MDININININIHDKAEKPFTCGLDRPIDWDLVQREALRHLDRMFGPDDASTNDASQPEPSSENQDRRDTASDLSNSNTLQ